MEQAEPQAVIESYMEAFEAKDLPRCLAFFDDEAEVEFMFSNYRGKQAIEEWHQERFDAGIQVSSFEVVEAEEDTVVVHLDGTSRRLQMFKIPSLKGTGTFRIERGQIQEARFAARKGFAGNMNWLFR